MADFSLAYLNNECLGAVLKHLPPASLGMCIAVNKHFRDYLQADDDLWRRRCEALYGVTQPQGPDQKPLPSFRAACGQWHLLCVKYGSLALRALRAWAQAKAWLQINFPEILLSLRPGASEEALNEAQRRLQTFFPPALRVLYRIHDGQDIVDRRIFLGRKSACMFQGLFGGYNFYSHRVSTRMLKLEDVYDNVFTSEYNETSSSILFAASSCMHKRVYCTANSAEVQFSTAWPKSYLPGRRLATQDHPPCPCPPAWVERASKDAGYAISLEDDGIICWFESYVSDLVSGKFGVRPLDPGRGSASRAICLFPSRDKVEAVTHGIRVSATPVFVPELANMDGDQWSYVFAYDIEFRFEPGEDEGGGGTREHFRAMRKVQLRDRHWVIYNSRDEINNEVRGEGVVGEFPLLMPGDRFEYQSCIQQQEVRGSMEGSFTFVEGSLDEPGARIIKAICPRFRLDVPSIIY